MEHLCPSCGYVWEGDGFPPTPAMKRAVSQHLAGEASSVMAALLAPREPEFRARMARVQGWCDLNDLTRYRRQQLMAVDRIKVGEIYCWEPDKWQMGAASVCKVTKIEHRPNGDVFVWARAPGEYREFYNDLSRCQEAFVRTDLKFLPDNYN